VEDAIKAPSRRPTTSAVFAILRTFGANAPEDQIEVLQCQRAKPALSPDVGKNALGQLRQDQFFFDNREPAGLHGAHCEIRRDIVQAFSRDMNKKVTMMMFLLLAGA
jgi:hypothetical protein